MKPERKSNGSCTNRSKKCGWNGFVHLARRTQPSWVMEKGELGNPSFFFSTNWDTLDDMHGCLGVVGHDVERELAQRKARMTKHLRLALGLADVIKQFAISGKSIDSKFTRPGCHDQHVETAVEEIVSTQRWDGAQDVQLAARRAIADVTLNIVVVGRDMAHHLRKLFQGSAMNDDTIKLLSNVLIHGEKSYSKLIEYSEIRKSKFIGYQKLWIATHGSLADGCKGPIVSVGHSGKDFNTESVVLEKFCKSFFASVLFLGDEASDDTRGTLIICICQNTLNNFQEDAELIAFSGLYADWLKIAGCLRLAAGHDAIDIACFHRKVMETLDA